MEAVLKRIRGNAAFRPAIAAPILISIVFSLFNLSAAPDQARLAETLTIGVVNLDKGVPLVPVKVSDQLLIRMGSALPFGIETYPDEEAARAALEEGDVTAVLSFPADFSLKAMGKDPAAVKVINTQHLSLAQTQFGIALPQQFQGMLAAAIASFRLAVAQGNLPAPPAAGEAPPPIQLPATVETETLYTAAGPAALAAPFVMTFATWMAALVGGMMLFVATRGERHSDSAQAVAIVRTMLPVAVGLVASLCLALVVAWTTGQWGSFLGLWAVAWLAVAGITLLIAGLFAVLGFWALVVAVPAVFYQSALAGAQAPVALAPEWLRRVGEALPFSDLAASYRAVVVGGPPGSIAIWTILAAAAIGIALIWLGTWAYALLIPRKPAAAHG